MLSDFNMKNEINISSDPMIKGRTKDDQTSYHYSSRFASKSLRNVFAALQDPKTDIHIKILAKLANFQVIFIS